MINFYASGFLDGSSTEANISAQYDRLQEILQERESIKSRFISLVALKTVMMAGKMELAINVFKTRPRAKL